MFFDDVYSTLAKPEELLWYDANVVFLNSELKKAYKHPSGAITVKNLSDKDMIATSFSENRMIKAVVIEKNKNVILDSGNMVKIFNWNENLCPLSECIVFD